MREQGDFVEKVDVPGGRTIRGLGNHERAFNAERVLRIEKCLVAFKSDFDALRAEMRDGFGEIVCGRAAGEEMRAAAFF